MTIVRLAMLANVAVHGSFIESVAYEDVEYLVANNLIVHRYHYGDRWEVTKKGNALLNRLVSSVDAAVISPPPRGGSVTVPPR